MNYVKAYHVSTFLGVVGIVLAFCLQSADGMKFWLMAAGAVLCFITALWILFHYFRCPHCKRLLPSKSWRLDFCPYCNGFMKK